MAVTLTSPVAGQDAGTEYSGPMEAWLVANGYAKDSELTDKSKVTGVKADQDPTLASNREAQREKLEILGTKVEGDPEKPVEDGQRKPEPLPVVEVPFVGQTDESGLREQLDGSVNADEVSDETPAVQAAATEAAEDAAGTGDNLAQEPTADSAPVEDAPAIEPAPERTRKVKDA